VKLDAGRAANIRDAAQRIANGDLVAFPTETVYGLGARADSDAAVAKIFTTKGRPSGHPLIVHVADVHSVPTFAAEVPDAAHRLMQACWPGPVTLILKRSDGVATAAAAGQGTIGLRCPSHPVAQALLRDAAALGVPGIAGPSANRFGRVSPTTADHVASEFGDELTVLDGGACDIGIESAIVDVTRARPALLRPGALSLDELRRAANVDIDPMPGDDAPRAAGTLDAHYAPKAKLRLMETKMLANAIGLIADVGVPGLAVYSRAVRVPATSTGSGQARGLIVRRMPDSARAAAHELYTVLRELDAAGATLIWVEQLPAEADWDGVRDRLQRAAASSA
jgi:L-threonylcarbamoyladenylate synthase